MKNYAIVIVILCLFCVSCKKDDGVLSDREYLEYYNKLPFVNDHDDIQNNVDLAISKYENEKIEQEPVILMATLGYTVASPESLHIVYYDENKDALGIGIKEKYIDPNGIETTLIEEYPIFIFRSPNIMTLLIRILVKFRDSGQRKSKQQWDEYINVDSLKAEEIRKLPHDEWSSNLPDVWLSIPEPNKVEVEMYIYDKEGNKSNLTPVYWGGDKWNRDFNREGN